VDSAVDSAVRSAVDRDVLTVISRAYYTWMPGRFGWGAWGWGLSPWWQSYWAFFRDVVGLDLDGDLWDRTRGAEQATTAGYWWPFADFVMVCDAPTELHVETAGGAHRMHCETGPAIRWADGYGIYMWHGTQVPGDLIETGWATDRILREPNAEVRRCAIERMGWDQFIADAHLSQVGSTVPDPGNPGHHLALYDVPERIYDAAIRVLLCTNGTVERDGRRRRFGLTVPATITDPLSAAAWTYGVPVEQYQRLEVRR
jgi:hypothetical protein